MWSTAGKPMRLSSSAMGLPWSITWWHRALSPRPAFRAATLFLVTPGRRQLTPLLRALRDFIAERTAALERQAE